MHDTFTTHPVRPSPPQNVQVAAEEDRSLVVEWAAPPADGGSPITGYRVQWKTGDGDFNTGDTTDAGALRHTVTGLTNGSVHTVRVIAVNAVGDSDPSNEVTGTPRPPPPVITGATAALDSLTVTWAEPADNAGSPISGYLVQWQSGDEGFDAATRQAAVSGTTHPIVGLSQGTQYQVRVRAVNEAGVQGDWSDTFTSVTLGGEPTNISLDGSRKHGELRVTWDPPLDADTSIITGYKVEWSESDDFGSFDEATGRSTAYLRYVIGNLPPLTTYHVRVRAVNAGGEGPSSDAVSRQVPRRPAAPVITGVAAGDGELNIEWTAAETYGGKLVAYNIEWRTGEDPPFPTLQVEYTPTYPNRDFALPSATSHSLTGLTNGTQYQVRVFALNRYQGGMCISGVLKTTERTTLNLTSPLDPSWVATGSAVWRYVHFTLALV